MVPKTLTQYLGFFRKEISHDHFVHLPLLVFVMYWHTITIHINRYHIILICTGISHICTTFWYNHGDLLTKLLR